MKLRNLALIDRVVREVAAEFGLRVLEDAGQAWFRDDESDGLMVTLWKPGRRGWLIIDVDTFTRADADAAIDELVRRDARDLALRLVR